MKKKFFLCLVIVVLSVFMFAKTELVFGTIGMEKTGKN